MALIEVDADELAKLNAELNAARNYKQFFEGAEKNPASRRKLYETIKAFRPDVNIPELEASEQIHAKVEEIKGMLTDKEESIKKSIEEEKKAREEHELELSAKEKEREIRAQIESERNKLRSRGHTKETIEEIEKIMQERGIIDYEAAEALYEKQHPPEPMADSSAIAGDSAWNLFGTETSEDDSLLARGDQRSIKRWTDLEIAKWKKEKAAGKLRA